MSLYQQDASPLKSVVLIPHFVHRVIQRHNANLTELLNPSFVKKHFSMEDAVHILTLNEDYTKMVFGIERPCRGVWSNWGKDGEYLQQLEVLKPIHAPTIVERLFSPESRQARFDSAFSIDDPSRDYTFVTIYPGYFGEPEAQSHQKALVVAVLKLCYAYNLYHTVANDVLFKSYISELRSA